MVFKAINWNPNEAIGEARMDQMTDNAEWLYLNTPRAIYTTPGGLRRAEGIKIASGRIIIPKRATNSATAEVRFGNFFSYNCDPNITVGVVSPQQPRIFASVRGIGKVLPDNRGFEVQVVVAAENKANNKIATTLYVNFSAMGY
jgi:hypothetical protein